MKRRFMMILTLLALLLSCANNVYIDEYKDEKEIWRLNSGDSALYFNTANEAISYIIGKRDINSYENTLTLMRPVLAEGSDGVISSSYEKYVENDKFRGSIEVPSSFTGSLRIDLNGYRYDFSNKCDAFFRIEGGSKVYICNGKSVIFNEASHEPYAIAVDTDIVAIDDHLLDDRREDNNLIYVGENGHLSLDKEALSGRIAVVTDGKSGATLDISDTTITISNIYTMYKNSDGSLSDVIDSAIAIEDSAKSRINISSGDISIMDINQKRDYYDAASSILFDKAILNILGREENTTIGTRHIIDEVVSKAIEESSGSAVHKIIHDMIYSAKADATCVKEGHKEYWTCSSSDECIGRYYTKEDGSEFTQDYSDLVIAIDPNGHSLEHIPYKKETCTEDGNKEYWHCTLCGKYYSDEKAAELISNISTTIIPHHVLSDWDYDIDSHWKLCPVDGKVFAAAHSWGEEWLKHTSGSVTHLYKECSICGARKVAQKPEYLVYSIGIGEIELKNIEATPCGDFYINGEIVEDNATVYVDKEEVVAEFRALLGSNTNYKPYSYVVNNGQREITGEKDDAGDYKLTFTLSNKASHALNIQLNTEGGSLSFGCYIYLK